tara:strand:- start:54 stop:752 length:699 start_codon:yes stop_codon:yes gene_type:complete
MNIYSHLVTLPVSCSPYAAHGVIAPDLWPKFTRVYNSSRLNAGKMLSDPIVKDWMVGVQWHIHLDQHFHNLDTFHRACISVTDDVQRYAESLGWKRCHTIAHVWIELMLDGWLLNQQDVSSHWGETLSESYNTLVNRLISHVPDLDLLDVYLQRLSWCKESHHLSRPNQVKEQMLILDKILPERLFCARFLEVDLGWASAVERRAKQDFGQDLCTWVTGCEKGFDTFSKGLG